MKTVSPKTTCLIVLAIICISLLPGYDYAANQTKAEKPKPTFFIQTANKAVLTPINKDGNEFNLALVGVNSRVSFVTDRPDRHAGNIKLTEYLKAWSEGADSFTHDNPNAVLAADTIDKAQDDAIFILAKPRYDANRDTMVYDAKLLQGNLGKSQKPIYLKNVTMFIDSIHWNPGHGW